MKWKNIIANLGFFTSVATVFAQLEDCPDYSSYSNYVSVPFTGSDSSTPAIRLKLKSRRDPKSDIEIKNVGLDSGSTIFALRSTLVPDFENEDKSGLKRGYVIYTNNKLWSGYYYPITFEVRDADGDTVTMQVEALAVTSQCICTWWTEANGPDCPRDSEGNLCEQLDENMHYMGIRFGYNYNATRGFTPDKNALLRVTKFNNIPISESTYRQGYVMKQRYIDIGLSYINTKSFRCTKLEKPADSNARFDWKSLKFSLKLDDTDWKAGTALIDTGLDSLQIDSHDCAIRRDKTTKTLNPGTKVDLAFPDEAAPAARYSFVWNGPNNLDGRGMPSEAICADQEPIFVNTGKHFYDRFDSLYDAEQGYWGARDNPSQSPILYGDANQQVL